MKEGILGRLEGVLDSVFVAFEPMGTTERKGAFKRFFTNSFSNTFQSIKCYFTCTGKPKEEGWKMWAAKKVIGAGCDCDTYMSGGGLSKPTQLTKYTKKSSSKSKMLRKFNKRTDLELSKKIVKEYKDTHTRMAGDGGRSKCVILPIKKLFDKETVCLS